MDAPLILWFDEVSLGDVPRVGGKNASLGEMRRSLDPRGVQVPNGFATTADAYRAFLRDSELGMVLDEALGSLDVTQIEMLQQAGRRIRKAILGARFPEPLADSIVDAYRRLEAEYGPQCDVAVRSSATAEDLPEASFAGQQETYLNIRGERMLLDAVHRCFASLFTDRAIVYRAQHGFEPLRAARAIPSNPTLRWVPSAEAGHRPGSIYRMWMSRHRVAGRTRAR